MILKSMKKSSLITCAIILFIILLGLIIFACFKLNNDSCNFGFNQNQKDSCYYVQAKNLNQTSSCTKIKSAELSNNCYSDLARVMLKESICDNIKNSDEQSTCHYSVQGLLVPEILIKSIELRISGTKDDVENLEYQEGQEYYINDPTIDGLITITLEAANKNLEDVTFNAECDIEVSDEKGQAGICSYLEACDLTGFPSWTNMNLNATISEDMQKIISLPRDQTAQFNLYVSPNPIKEGIKDKFGIEFSQDYIHVVNCNIQFASETQKIGKTVFIRNYFVKA